MDARARFSLDVSLKVKFSSNMEVDFDGDFAAWGGLGAAVGLNFGFDVDLSGLTAFEQELELDIDDDGVLETVTYLGFSAGSAGDVERGFATWEGDAYTFDEGFCYVLSWEGEQAWLMSGPCDGSDPALVCPFDLDTGEVGDCEACDAQGNCSSCESGSVSACVERAAEALGDQVPMIPSVDATATGSLGGDAGISVGGELGVEAGATVGGELGVEAGGSVGGEVNVSAEIDLCRSQVDRLSSEGQKCGQAPLDAERLCETRLADVSACFLAVEAVGLFGSPCSVIRGTACRGVF